MLPNLDLTLLSYFQGNHLWSNNLSKTNSSIPTTLRSREPMWKMFSTRAKNLFWRFSIRLDRCVLGLCIRFTGLLMEGSDPTTRPRFPALQDEYTPLNAQYAIGIHGYVLVYSIVSRTSFEMIQIIYDKIVDFSGVVDIPCVIVGSKSDLVSRWVLIVDVFTLHADSGLPIQVVKCPCRNYSNWLRITRLLGQSAAQKITSTLVSFLCLQKLTSSWPVIIIV